MSCVTCSLLVLEACRNCKVCANLLEHLQIPQSWTCSPKFGSQCWKHLAITSCPVFLPCFLLTCIAEIPFAPRQPHDITPPGESPILGDADIALTGEALSAKPIFGPDFEPHSGVIHKSQFCWKAASGIWLFWNKDCQDGRNWRDGRSQFPLDMCYCGRSKLWAAQDTQSPALRAPI